MLYLHVSRLVARYIILLALSLSEELLKTVLRTGESLEAGKFRFETWTRMSWSSSVVTAPTNSAVLQCVFSVTCIHILFRCLSVKVSFSSRY